MNDQNDPIRDEPDDDLFIAEPGDEPGDAGETEGVLCGACMTVNDELESFCVNCGKPIGKYVNNDPWHMIRSQGWTYGQAADRPSRLGVWGMVLIFGPTVITNLWAISMVIRGLFARLTGADQRRFYEGPSTDMSVGEIIVAGLFVAGLTWLHVAIITKTIHRYRRGRGEVNPSH